MELYIQFYIFILKIKMKIIQQLSFHDVKMINKNLSNINKVNNESNYFNLLADNAYKTQDEFKLDNKIVKKVTSDKKLLEKKYKIFKQKI